MIFSPVMCFEYNFWVTLFNDHLIIQEIAVFKLVVSGQIWQEEWQLWLIIFPNFYYREEKTLVKHLVKYLEHKLLEIRTLKNVYEKLEIRSPNHKTKKKKNISWST